MSQEILTKKCSECQETKFITEFHKNKTQLDGLHNCCKICRKQNAANFYIKNKNKINLKHKQYDLLHKTDISIRKKLDRKQNPDKFRKRRIKFEKENKDILRIKAKIYKKKKYHNNPVYKLERILRVRQATALKNNKKSNSTNKLNGCTNKYFKIHIENQFYNNMFWNILGNGYGKWQIHHICPLEFFDLRDPIEQKQAFYYTNTKPLWYEDHCEEHKKINEHMKQYAKEDLYPWKYN